MSLVQLLEPKWYFIYITGTHSGLGDDPVGYYVDISIVIKYFSIYTILIKWLVAYKCDYRSHIKQLLWIGF